MTDLDTLLRESLELQAERAPRPEQVRAWLDARLQPHRTWTRRRSNLRPVTLATVATAGIITGVALAAVTVAGLPHPGDGSPTALPGPAATSTASGSEPAAAATSADGTFAIALRFSPTALPAGWHEVSRSLSGNRLGRTWRAGEANLDGSDAGPRLDFHLLPSTEASLSQANLRSVAVTVAGRPARFLGGGDKSILQWEVAPGTGAQIGAIKLTRAQVLAAAESVRPDTRSATFP